MSPGFDVAAVSLVRLKKKHVILKLGLAKDKNVHKGWQPKPETFDYIYDSKDYIVLSEVNRTVVNVVIYPCYSISARSTATE